ncbi:DUF2061 domain-containing protein [Caulobacter sp. 73W]|uniref:DUF2061 domain-containing protein n=1 Tax=Caulobacter sp. 73W TaxID=3161137 RepID=A0AB39KNH4_9CAUL
MRLALKTLTYATMHLTVAVAVAYVLTRSWKVALAVGIIEPMVQTITFNLHERAWTRADKRRAQKDQARVSTEPPSPAASALA